MLVSQTLKYGKNSRLICVVILTSLLFSTCSDELSRARPYVLTTATTGGTFYPVGVAIATIAHAQLAEGDGVSMTAISSAGSLENIKLLRDLNLLSGERYVLGARNSGAEQTGRFILDSLGIDYQEKFTLAYMGYGPTTSAIQDGNIVGMNIPAGAPVSSITQAYALMGERMTILSWNQESLDAINARYPRWDWYEFPPGTYPNQTELITTVASPNVLVTRADIPHEVVYNITKVIWENLGTLHEIHRATRDMRMEIAVEGLGAPLHQGAIQYFREIGLDIPPRLLLEEAEDRAGSQGSEAL